MLKVSGMAVTQPRADHALLFDVLIILKIFPMLYIAWLLFRRPDTVGAVLAEYQATLAADPQLYPGTFLLIRIGCTSSAAAGLWQHIAAAMSTKKIIILNKLPDRVQLCKTRQL